MAHILVIDDDEAIRHFVCELLKEAGHTVSSACDGEVGAKCYRTQTVDLVVTDLEMPNRGGLDVIRELKASFSDTRIIAVTGARPETANQALSLGADFIFFKPFSVGGFLNAVDSLTAGSGG